MEPRLKSRIFALRPAQLTAAATIDQHESSLPCLLLLSSRRDHR